MADPQGTKKPENQAEGKWNTPSTGKDAQGKQRPDSGDKASAGQKNSRDCQDQQGNDSASGGRNADKSNKQNKPSDADADAETNEENSGETRQNPRAM